MRKTEKKDERIRRRMKRGNQQMRMNGGKEEKRSKLG